MLRNRHVPQHWLAVHPKRYEDDKGNRQCIGARVEIRSPGFGRHTDLTAGNSFSGCDAPEVYFDLGKLDQVDYVRVTFPSGAQRSLRDVKANQVLTVTGDPLPMHLGRSWHKGGAR